VALARTDVSEESITSLLGRNDSVIERLLLVTVNFVFCSSILVTLMTEAKHFRNVGSYKSHMA
jgi:hypothetical protein